MFLRIIAALLPFGLLPALAVDLEGQLAGNVPPGPLVVELRRVDGRGPAERADVHFDGAFRFPRLAPGTYHVSLETPHRTVLHTELVQIGEHSGTLTLRLKTPVPAVPHNGVVSLERLRRAPSREARKEFERAAAALRRDRPDRALAHLKNAVRIDPGYVEAHNNLGVRYLLDGDVAAARRHFDAALAIDPSLAEVHSNLSLLELAGGDPAASERHARRALALGADPLKCDYLLGLALLRQARLAEALPLLERAAPQFPHARRVLEQLPRNQAAPVSRDHRRLE